MSLPTRDNPLYHLLIPYVTHLLLDFLGYIPGNQLILLFSPLFVLFVTRKFGWVLKKVLFLLRGLRDG
jgi:hypothetical protein